MLNPAPVGGASCWAGDGADGVGFDGVFGFFLFEEAIAYSPMALVSG